MDARFRVIATADEVEQIQEFATSAGARTEILTPRALDPGTVTLLIVGSIAAVATVQAAIETFRGGQVIDLRPEAATPFYRTRKLHYGLIAIIAVDGGVQISVAEPKEMFGEVIGLLETLLRPGEALSTQALQARLAPRLLELEGVTLSASPDSEPAGPDRSAGS